MNNQIYSHQIVIVGGGCTGITTAAQFLAKDKNLHIAIIEPSEKHYYQPGWTLISGRILKSEQIVHNQKYLRLYWHRMLKGSPFETNIFKKLGLQ